jgi:hypothetical protein
MSPIEGDETMRHFWIALCGCMFIFTPLIAAEPAQTPSPTFADILSRVVLRDKDSGAILTVKMKEDAPQHGSRSELNFKMEEKPGDQSVVIELSPPSMVSDVCEQYQLQIDPSIREELDKLKLMQKQGVEKAIKMKKEQTERIEKLSDGKLKYGMTEQEVIAVLGKPKGEFRGYQHAGRFRLEYDRYYLNFMVTLRDMEMRDKE